MKCKRLFMVFFLVFFFLVFVGSLSAGSNISQYEKLQKSYESLSENLNRLVILSQTDLMELQKELPELIKQAEKLNNDLGNLLIKAQSLTQESGKLISELTELKLETEKLLESLTNSEKITNDLEKQMKQAEIKINIGLGISGVALIAIIAKILYDIFGGKE